MTAVNAVALPTDPAWAEIARRAPKMAVTMGRYLDQIAVSLRPSSVFANDNVLRLFAAHIIATDPKTRSVARIQPDPHRGLQAGPHRQANPFWHTAFHQHPPDATGNAADVLRADHRMGL